MAWGNKEKEKLTTDNAVMRKEIELLQTRLEEVKGEKEQLRLQLVHTQEALIAKESPEAYRDQKYMEELADMPPPTPEQIEAQKRRAAEAEVAGRFVSAMEQPLFKDATDMIQILTRASGPPLRESKSLHGNDES